MASTRWQALTRRINCGKSYFDRHFSSGQARQKLLYCYCFGTHFSSVIRHYFGRSDAKSIKEWSEVKCSNCTIISAIVAGILSFNRLLFQNLCRIYALFRKKSKICTIFGKADYMFFSSKLTKICKKICFMFLHRMPKPGYIHNLLTLICIGLLKYQGVKFFIESHDWAQTSLCINCWQLLAELFWLSSKLISRTFTIFLNL